MPSPARSEAGALRINSDLMADTETTTFILAPERFLGELFVAETRLPISVIVSADRTGRLKFEVDSVEVNDVTRPAAVAVMRNSGRTGSSIQYYRLELQSEDGKRLVSDHAYDNGWSHGDGLKIRLATAEARLTWRLVKPCEYPHLRFWLRGFSCMLRTSAEGPLGTAVAHGTRDIPDLMKMTGYVAVQANDRHVSSDWRGRAEDFLRFLRMGLSFANSGWLSTPLVEFFIENEAEFIFYNVGGANQSELDVQNFLDLEPIFSAFSKTHENIGHYRDILVTAIGWLIVDTHIDEVRFLSGMIALETLASHCLSKEQRRITSRIKANEIRDKISILLKKAGLHNEQIEAMENYLSGINRKSLRQNISTLFAHWQVSREGIDDSSIRKVVDLRNNIVHRGMPVQNQDLWESIVLIREIIVRFVLHLIGFTGTYECYLGGLHTRTYPACMPVGLNVKL